jgi:PAS domain-containing protein
MDTLFDSAVFMRHALDAIPSLVLVTDEDVRILYRNQAAQTILKGEKIYGNKAGDIMHCIHAADAAGGCGQGPHCADCVVRNSVGAAFSGKKVYRQRADISVRTEEKTLNIPALISVSPFTFEGKLYSLMVIEDISELAELRALLPICSSCKKIRTEENHWEKVETYIKRNVPQVNLSHGLCPDCAKKLYPDHSD